MTVQQGEQPTRKFARLQAARCRFKPEWSLPIEIGDRIAKCLEKWHLKTLRLVSKGWNELAIPHLFDTIWISLRQADIDVFRSITERSHLACHVKTLLVDMTCFRKIASLTEFIRGFFYFAQTYNEHFLSLGLDGNHPILQLVNDSRFKRLVDLDTMEPGPYEGWDRLILFLKESYQAWQAMTIQEQGCPPHIVTNLIKRTKSIHHLKYEMNPWASLRKRFSDEEGPYSELINYIKDVTQGPPFYKTWNPFFMRPSRPLNEDDCQSWGLFEAVISGLCQARHQVLTFKSGRDPRGMSLEWLQRLSRPEHHGTFYVTFGALRSLSITINSSHARAIVEQNNPCGILPSWLPQLSSLRKLSLDLRTRPYRPPAGPPIMDRFGRLFSYKEVFGVVKGFPSLSSLGLFGMTLTFHDLWSLINMSPQLDWLCLNFIQLSSGSWEGAIYYLSFSQITKYMYVIHFMLKDKEGRLFPRSTEENHREFYSAVKLYIERGGRHPSLPDHLPDASAEWYFHDMFEDGQADQYLSTFNAGKEPSSPRPW